MDIDGAIQQLMHRHEVAKPEVEKWDKKIKTVYRQRRFIEKVLWEQKHKAKQLQISIVADDALVECMALDLDDDVRVFVISELCDYLQRLIMRFNSERDKHYVVDCSDILSYLRRNLVGDVSTDLGEVNRQCRDEWEAIA